MHPPPSDASLVSFVTWFSGYTYMHTVEEEGAQLDKEEDNEESREGVEHPALFFLLFH